MSRTGWRVVRAVIGALVIGFAVRALATQWDEVQEQGIAWAIRWPWIAASLLLTWGMYLGLVWGWRGLIVAWGERLPYWTGVRIWLLSGLGRYVPGKVWSLLGMAVLAQRAGVSGTTAMASSVVMQLLALVTGAAVALALLGSSVLEAHLPGGVVGTWLLAALALSGALLVTRPRVMRWLGARAGLPDTGRTIRFEQLLMAGLPNLAAWLGYGVALVWLAEGTLAGIDLDWPLATGAFTASYLAGYLFLLAPGGIGVRESVMILLLQDTIGVGNAAALAATSRLALTVNELGVALPLLLIGRPSRDDA